MGEREPERVKYIDPEIMRDGELEREGGEKVVRVKDQEFEWEEKPT